MMEPGTGVRHDRFETVILRSDSKIYHLVVRGLKGQGTLCGLFANGIAPVGRRASAETKVCQKCSGQAHAQGGAAL